MIYALKVGVVAVVCLTFGILMCCICWRDPEAKKKVDTTKIPKKPVGKNRIYKEIPNNMHRWN